MDNVLGLFKFAANACGTKTGIMPSLYDNIQCTNNNQPIIVSAQDIMTLMINIIQILMFAAGSLAVITILVASVYYITAMGDPGRVKRAKDIILYTFIGLGVIIMASAVITYISEGF